MGLLIRDLKLEMSTLGKAWFEPQDEAACNQKVEQATACMYLLCHI